MRDRLLGGGGGGCIKEGFQITMHAKMNAIILF